MINVTHVTWGYPSPVAEHEATYFSVQLEALSKIAETDVGVISPLTYIPGIASWIADRWVRRLNIPLSYHFRGVEVKRPRFMRLPAPESWQMDLALLEGVIRGSLRKRLPDLVHVHGGNSFGLAGLRAAKSLGLPTVLTLHGGDVYLAPGKSRRHRSIFLECLQIAGKCLGVSEDLAMTAKRLSGIEVQHLPIGVNLQAFRPIHSAQSARRQYSLPISQPVVLFLGNLLESKGVTVLLKAMEMLGTENVAVFGGEGPLEGAVKCHPRARWIGPIPYADVPRVIGAADVFVLPSFSEGLGLVLVEAGAMEVPVIGTNVGGIPSLLSDGRGCLIPAKDARALAACIDLVLNDRASARARSLKFVHFIREHHDASKNAAQLFAIYERLLYSRGS